MRSSSASACSNVRSVGGGSCHGVSSGAGVASVTASTRLTILDPADDLAVREPGHEPVPGLHLGRRRAARAGRRPCASGYSRGASTFKGLSVSSRAGQRRQPLARPLRAARSPARCSRSAELVEPLFQVADPLQRAAKRRPRRPGRRAGCGPAPAGARAATRSRRLAVVAAPASTSRAVRRRRAVGRLRRRQRPVVGDQVGDGHVGLVADAADTTGIARARRWRRRRPPR